MTGLLVSVRSVEEAECALGGGANLIDIKEPNNGPLGAAPWETIQAIFEQVGARAPVSAALGELLHLSIKQDPTHSQADLARLPSLAFAKMGLAGCSKRANWPIDFAQAWSQLPSAIGRVAVAYGDWRQCDGIAPEEVIQVGGMNGCGHFLLDTVDKTDCLLNHVSGSQISKWVALARTHNMKVVIAGSVTIDQLPLIIARWKPAMVAVRGAVCMGKRDSKISESKVHSLSQKLQEIVATSPVNVAPG